MADRAYGGPQAGSVRHQEQHTWWRGPDRRVATTRTYTGPERRRQQVEMSGQVGGGDLEGYSASQLTPPGRRPIVDGGQVDDSGTPLDTKRGHFGTGRTDDMGKSEPDDDSGNV